MTVKIHLDTDIGGDIDDLCALAMVLRWDGVELTGITTSAETNGRRAGYARRVLELEKRNDIPVAAGAQVSGGSYRFPELAYPDEIRYWSLPCPAAPTPLEDALELLRQSIEQGAVLAAIGPYTNLCLLDRKYPGILKQARLFLMGGCVLTMRAGFPSWGNDSDWNIQLDISSARHVIENSDATLVPITVTCETALRRIYLERLRRSGGLGELIARQAEAFAEDEQMERRFGETCAGVPRDIINFLHDPLACAVALGWTDGIEIQELPITLAEEGGWLHERIDPSGRPRRIVTGVDGPRFSEFWLHRITG